MKAPSPAAAIATLSAGAADKVSAVVSRTSRLRGDITTRLHWTDKPYKWHVNDGEEVFVVLNGTVEMHYRINCKEYRTLLEAGDIFHAGVGMEHVAHPQGEARILVVENADSV